MSEPDRLDQLEQERNEQNNLAQRQITADKKADKRKVRGTVMGTGCAHHTRRDTQDERN